MTDLVEAGVVDRKRQHDDLICALLRGDAVAWPGPDDDEAVEAFIARADFHGTLPLLDDRFRVAAVATRWPEAIKARCRADALSWVAWDLAQRGDTARLLAAFRDAQLSPLVLKGAALACSHYTHPGMRPRGDLDLIVPEAAKGRAEEVLQALGYVREGVPMGKYVFHESQWNFVNGQGASHDVDLHWRSNNSPTLAKLLAYEEMQARAVGVPGLGSDAFTPCAVHALLFACMHRIGHSHAPMYADGVAEPAKDRIIWLYDIHLLASRMSGDELEEVASLALSKRMTVMVREALELCETRFRLGLPQSVKARLSQGSANERTAATFRGNRIRQMVSDALAIKGIGHRFGWLLELAFPPAQYMRFKYPADSHSWLPVLYARRVYSGIRNAMRK